jgi:perosamine synthetase
MSLPDIDDADVSAVVEVLRSDRLSLGPRVEEFERSVSSYVGVKHAVAVSSGTAALHLIIKGLEIGPGDEVLVPSFTFAASVNAILYEGATPVFVDIEPDTYNINPDDIEHRLTDRTRAIMVVDVFGHPADWPRLNEIAKRHNLLLVDDSCEALGARINGRMLGQFGDAAAFAFYPNKQMTTGEGGMIVTNNDELAELCRSLRNQGRGEMGAWLEHERLGYNYRLNEMSAALGCTQMKRIDTFLQQRSQVAEMYTQRLRNYDWVRPPLVRPEVFISWFVYVITLAEHLNRDEVMSRMEEQGVPVRAYFEPMHSQPYIKRGSACVVEGLSVTESIASRTVALPFHNRLTIEQIDYVVEVLANACEDRKKWSKSC